MAGCPLPARRIFLGQMDCDPEGEPVSTPEGGAMIIYSPTAIETAVGSCGGSPTAAGTANPRGTPPIEHREEGYQGGKGSLT